MGATFVNAVDFPLQVCRRHIYRLFEISGLERKTVENKNPDTAVSG
jgi:hypothetical protein